MSNSNQISNVATKTINDRLNFLVFISVLGLSVFAIIYIRGHSFLDSIFKLRERSIAIEVSNWDVPIFLSLPCFISIIIALILRLTDYDNDMRIQRCISVALIFAFLSIAVRIPYGFAVRSYMESLGYSPCWQLSSPGMMSPTVWVRNAGYCIENVGSIREPLLQWMNIHPKGGDDITPGEVRVKAEELLNNFNQEQKIKYPGIFYEEKQ